MSKQQRNTEKKHTSHRSHPSQSSQKFSHTPLSKREAAARLIDGL
jgi:hypothetical protein